MNKKTNCGASQWMALALLAGALFSVNANAQQLPVREMKVQLAAGFNTVNGRLITAGDTIVFLNDTQPQASFSATRSQIEQVIAGQGQSLIFQFKEPIRNQEGERVRVEFRVSPQDSDALRAWSSQPKSAGEEANKVEQQAVAFPTYSARRNKFLGGDDGRLVVKSDRLAFEASNAAVSREWLFSDIREVEQKGPYRLEIQPFTGDKYSLELLGGGGMASEDYKRLADSIARARSNR